ncbi:MAG: hypothetical protein QXL57_02640 [Candidatus Bathyarchaeia archaeon]
MAEIQNKYGRAIEVKRWDFSSNNGSTLFRQYNLTKIPSIVINAKEILLDQEITQDKLQSIINSILNYPMSEDLPGMIHLGVLSFLSPSVITLLFFIMSYTVDEDLKMKNWIKNAIVFSLGLIIAQLVIFSLFFLNFSFTNFQILLRYVIRFSSICLIIGGLELFGLTRFPYEFSFLKKLKNCKNNLKFIGIFCIGGLFFVIETFNTPSFSYALLSATNLPLLLGFSVGVLIPFLTVGLICIKIVGILIVAIKGDVQRMRLISGAILIAYASWLMLKILLRQF